MAPRGPQRKSGSSNTTSSRAARLLRSAFTLYLLCAVLYTAYSFLVKPTVHLFTGPTQAELQAAADALAVSSTNDTQSTRQVNAEEALSIAARIREDSGEALWEKKKSTGADHHRLPAAKIKVGVENTNWGINKLNWHAPSDPLAHAKISPADQAAVAELVDRKATPMAEDFFLSKAFGETLQPSKVIPYYYKASHDHAQEDITITTLVTSNRFKVFAALVERYQGPVSVTIHVTNNEGREELLESLDALYTTSPYMSTYVDVHLVIDNFDRQFNMWRNVAKFFARTDYVMMLDVDFWVCTDFRNRILSSPAIMSKLREGTAAFVVPAFEFTKQNDGLDASTFPTDKADLVALADEGSIGMFHKSWGPGHGSTNYTRYYTSKPGEVYKVHAYTHSYEPYVVFKKEGTPYCDERFIGYGGNKAACLYELYLSGVSYFVLPDDFLIHQSHPYAEKARKHERRYNRKLYTDFREELCFRYLNQFIDSGMLDTARSKNLLIECKKIKGFSSAASKLITASRS